MKNIRGGLTPAVHASLLGELVQAVKAHSAFRFVEIGCSVARGAADEMSDIDVALGIADDDWPGALDALPPILRSVAEPVDVLEHRLPELGDLPHRRYFAQYRDGAQIDLVALPASSRPGLPVGNIAVYDPHGHLAQPLAVASEWATAQQSREWSFLGWVALADLDKYLRRASPWEALARLTLARDYLWRLWAVVIEARYPAFGLTSVLDHEPSRLPRGIELTVAGLELNELRAASDQLSELLSITSRQAAARLGSGAPAEMERFVREQLAEVRGSIGQGATSKKSEPC